MSLPSVTSNSWKHHFQHLVSADDANSHLPAFKKCTNGDTTDDFSDIIFTALSEDPDAVILAIAPAVTGKLKLYHSVQNLGGTRSRPKDKIVAMDGFGPLAIPVLFDSGMIVTKLESATPSLNDLFKTSSTDEIISLVENPTNISKHAIFTILPPLVFTKLLEIDSRDPGEIFIETVSILASYDEDIKDNTTLPKAKEHCDYILSFLWLATQGRVPALTCIADGDDKELQAWSKKRRIDCVLPISTTTPSFQPPPGLPPPQNPNDDSSSAIQELAQNIRNQTVVLERIRQEKQEDKEKSQKFELLHDSVKRLILNACSKDGESTPDSPP